MRPPTLRNEAGAPIQERRPTFLAVRRGPDPAPLSKILGEQPHVRTPMEMAVQRPHQLNALPLVPMNAAREIYPVKGAPSRALYRSSSSAAGLTGKDQLAKRPPGKAVVSVYAY